MQPITSRGYRDYACAALRRERTGEAGTGDKLKAVDVAYPINFSAPSISASPPVNFACVPHRDRTLDLLGEISGELLIYLPPSYYIILASRPSFPDSRVGQVKNRGDFFFISVIFQQNQMEHFGLYARIYSVIIIIRGGGFFFLL